MTDKAKPTPGPWFADTGCRGEPVFIYGTVNDDAVDVCTVPFRVGDAQAEADAALIAAAPDLLEACEAVAGDVCSFLCPSKWRTEAGQAHSAECVRLRAAIKKARGEP